MSRIIALSIVLSVACGCGGGPPALVERGPAMVDGGGDWVVGWLEPQGEKNPRPESIKVDCGTVGIYLGASDGLARLKIPGKPVVWIVEDWVKPLPAGRP